jgi:hypothetical protein
MLEKSVNILMLILREEELTNKKTPKRKVEKVLGNFSKRGGRTRELSLSSSSLVIHPPSPSSSFQSLAVSQ